MKITDVRTVLLTGPDHERPVHQESRATPQRGLHRDLHRHGTDRHRRDVRRLLLPEGRSGDRRVLQADPDRPDRRRHRRALEPDVPLRQLLVPRRCSGRSCSAASRRRSGTSRASCTTCPVYELLGGKKHEPPAVLCHRRTEQLSEGASWRPRSTTTCRLGFRGFKVGAGRVVRPTGTIGYMPMRPAEAADFEGDKADFMREHVGPDVNIMIDGHMGNNDQHLGPRHRQGRDEGRRAVRPFLLRRAATLHRSVELRRAVPDDERADRRRGVPDGGLRVARLRGGRMLRHRPARRLVHRRPRRIHARRRDHGRPRPQDRDPLLGLGRRRSCRTSTRASRPPTR